MSRIPGVHPAGASPVIKAAYAIVRRKMGKVPEPFAVTAHHPTLFAGYTALEGAVEKADSVDARLKELASLRAAQLCGCEFCLDIGSALGRRHGVTDRQIRELHLYQASDAFSDLERLVLDYASGMTRTPVEVSDELFGRLREHFDERQLVELTAVIAVENYRARFNWALAIGSQGFAEEGPVAEAAPAAA